MQKLLEIRPASVADAGIIHEIVHEAFSKYAFDLGRRELVYALAETERDIIKDIAGKHVLVALLDGVIVGSIRYEAMDGFGYLSRFGVKLAAQSCGVGRALVQAVVDGCKELGLSAVALHTSAKMSSLIRFYYAQGFYIRRTATDRGYLRALLVKELVPGYDVPETLKA